MNELFVFIYKVDRKYVKGTHKISFSRLTLYLEFTSLTCLEDDNCYDTYFTSSEIPRCKKK